MPRIVDADRRRRDIARAALRVFARKGYRLASMGDVARACAVGRTTLYQSFPNKQSMIEYAVQSALAGAVREAQAIARDPRLPWREKLREVLRVSMETFLADPAQTLVTLEFWLELCRSRPGSTGRRQVLRLSGEVGQMEKTLFAVFGEGVRARDLSSRHVRGLAFLTYSLLLSFCLQGLFNPEAPRRRSLGQMDLFIDAWASMPATARALPGGPLFGAPRRQERPRAGRRAP
jgi:AcrR family transcriptional regulator